MKAGTHGFFQGEFSDKDNQAVTFSGFGIMIPDTKVSLLSVPELCRHGHTVIHGGDTKKGSHGMTLYNGITERFIPFTFDDNS